MLICGPHATCYMLHATSHSSNKVYGDECVVFTVASTTIVVFLGPTKNLCESDLRKTFFSNRDSRRRWQAEKDRLRDTQNARRRVEQKTIIVGDKGWTWMENRCENIHIVYYHFVNKTVQDAQANAYHSNKTVRLLSHSTYVDAVSLSTHTTKRMWKWGHCLLIAFKLLYALHLRPSILHAVKWLCFVNFFVDGFTFAVDYIFCFVIGRYIRCVWAFLFCSCSLFNLVINYSYTKYELMANDVSIHYPRI